MNREAMNSYYKEIISRETTSSRQVGWRDELAQTRRFEQLHKLVEQEEFFEIADLGCGLAGFYKFLQEKEADFAYTGYDLSKDMLDGARKIIGDGLENTNLKLIEKTAEIAEHDFIVASGIFNIRGESPDPDWRKYILGQLDIINKKATKGFAFNLLTSYSDEELKRDELYYAAPGFFFDFCKKNFARNVALLHDYDEYDFTIIVRKRLH